MQPAPWMYAPGLEVPAYLANSIHKVLAVAVGHIQADVLDLWVGVSHGADRGKVGLARASAHRHEGQHLGVFSGKLVPLLGAVKLVHGCMVVHGSFSTRGRAGLVVGKRVHCSALQQSRFQFDVSLMLQQARE